MLAALAFFVAFALPIIWWPNTPVRVEEICTGVEWVTWGLFAVDYMVRLILTRDRRQFIVRNWFDLLVIALPMLRPMRLLRLVTVVSVINKRASANLRGRVGVYVGGASGLLATISAFAVLEAERGSPDSNITTVGEAFWWAAVTMTTVGYGDHYPVTMIGRAVAVGLMIAAIGAFGAVTGTLASWFVEKVSEAEEQSPLLAELRELRQEVSHLREQMSQQSE